MTWRIINFDNENVITYKLFQPLVERKGRRPHHTASQLLATLPAPVAGSLPCLHSPLTFPQVKLLHQLLLNVVILSDQGPELCDQGRPGPDVGRAPGPL